MATPLLSERKPFAILLLAGLLLSSCFTAGSGNDLAADRTKRLSKSYYSFATVIRVPLYETVRQKWLQLAPQPWVARIQGMIVDKKQADDVIFFQQQQWLLAFNPTIDATPPQLELRLATLIAKLAAFESSQMLLIYHYPETSDPQQQKLYLQEDQALVPPHSFLFFQPNLGRSFIPLPDSLIARYTQNFWPGVKVIYGEPTTQTPTPLPSPKAKNPIDDFVNFWLAVVYQKKPADEQATAKMDFIRQSEQLQRWSQHLRAAKSHA